MQESIKVTIDNLYKLIFRDVVLIVERGQQGIVLPKTISCFSIDPYYYAMTTQPTQNSD